MLAGAEDHLATFSFPGVSQTIVKSSTWGQCPQVLAGTARKVAKSTRLCSYTPHPCNMPQAKTEVALQSSECCAAEVALRHWLFCSAEVISTKSCAATSEKVQCNIEKAAWQESGAFLPLSCGFQAPTFRLPRLGPADYFDTEYDRAKVPRTTEAIPRRPWKAKSPFASRPIKTSIRKGTRGVHEVRHGTSSIHFHRAVPRSSSHTGPRLFFLDRPVKCLFDRDWPRDAKRVPSLLLGKTKSTVKVGSWSTVEPPSRRSHNRTLFCQNPQEVTFEEPVKRYSWRDTLTASLASLNYF